MHNRLTLLRLGTLSIAALTFLAAPVAMLAQQRHNVILFIADGMRRGSVNAEDTPAMLRVRTEGVDFRNSHSVFPTFTTANASVIATGHGIGDTGDYSNVIYPGVWLTKPGLGAFSGSVSPFLENDEVLASLNAIFGGNYLGEKTLLSAAQGAGFNTASLGKVGPAGIQQNDAVNWDQFGTLNAGTAVIIDDSTGQPGGLPLPFELADALQKAGLSREAPTRSNGYGEGTSANNGFSGDAVTPGTLSANHVQEQWFADVATSVLLPGFAASDKPFVLVFWSRDPDGTQHNQGDSLQTIAPGINGDTSKLGLRNADHCLAQLLAWLDANPKVKATTDVVITSDHGFATVSRREVAPDATRTAELSAALDYELSGKEKPQPRGTLPTGFLAVDLGVREHLRVFDPAVRATTGPSIYQEVLLGGEKSQHPSTGSAVLGDEATKLDGSDAKLIIASNGGSDLIYVPTKNVNVVRETVRILTQMDYVGGIFVDDTYCPKDTDCPGALRMSSIGMVGHSHVPRPAIAVTYKVFYQTPGDLQSAVQISDTTLQEGQGMHGGFGRDQTFNNMAAMGPDFKTGFADDAPMGNIDIAPTLAKVLRIEIPSAGTLRGRVVKEALVGGELARIAKPSRAASVPTASGKKTVLEYQEFDGVRYADKACLLAKDQPVHCE